MIGIIPGVNKTFVVSGYFCENPVQGQLYVDPESKRVFIYSTTETRSCVHNGFFPVWNGKQKIITNFSNYKTVDDIINTDIKTLSQSISKEVAENVLLEQKKHNSGNALDPVITNDDNFFTKCIKGVILNQKLSFNDLVEQSSSNINEKTIMIYYSSLIKTAFMRLDKWFTWVTSILHLNYKISVFDDLQNNLVTFEFPSKEFTCQDKNLLTKITDSDDLKRTIKLLIALKGIVKDQFKDESIDEYTINNMFTIINGNKPMSAQIFSRFIDLADLYFIIEIFQDGELIYSLKE